MQILNQQRCYIYSSMNPMFNKCSVSTDNAVECIK